jgi:septal ring factor EnvC (AmiA/AmiB activator)
MTPILASLVLTFQTLPPSEQQRLEDLERRIEEREASAAEIRERAEELGSAVDRLRNQLADTAEALQQAEADSTRLEQDLQDIEAREAVALERRDARSLELSKVLAALQNLQRSRPPALIVSPDNAQGAALAAISLSSLTPRLASIVDEQKAEITRLTELRAQKRAARATLETTNSALAERRRLLEDVLTEREAAYDKDREDLRRIEAETRRLAAEATNLRDLIERLQSLPSGDEVLRTYSLSRRDRRLPDTFAAARGLLERPVAGVPSGRFGETDDSGSSRDALELITRPGAVVTSPYSGRVQWASEFGALGKILIIDVGGGYTNILIGLDQFIARKGQRVSAGEPVGVMASGDVAPRLRFQVRHNGTPLDPDPWFEGN